MTLLPHELRITLAPAGKRRRRVYLGGGQPEHASAAGKALELQATGASRWFEVAVDAPMDVVIKFAP